MRLFIGRSKGVPGTRARPHPSLGYPNSFIFMQFLAKSLQNNHTFGVGAPSQENPGSATDINQVVHELAQNSANRAHFWASTFRPKDLLQTYYRLIKFPMPIL